MVKLIVFHDETGRRRELGLIQLLDADEGHLVLVQELPADQVCAGAFPVGEHATGVGGVEVVRRALEDDTRGRVVMIEDVSPDVAVDGADRDLPRERPATVGPLQIALLPCCRKLPLLDAVILSRERVPAVAGDLPGLEVVVHEIADLELLEDQIGQGIRCLIHLLLAEQPIRQTHAPLSSAYR
ncbi:MAG: hypothetical protein MK365_09025 [Vicinamibacterales bacterium]|nr:hypothetical protein [Vicinamibacterales bacterium]